MAPNNHLDILKLYTVPQFSEGVIFQHDGASPHYANIAHEFLVSTFRLWWIGRGSLTPWPSRSPDLTRLDFYLWGYGKQDPYRERINDINHLKQTITDFIHSVTADVPNSMWEELDYHLNVCRAKNVGDIELH